MAIETAQARRKRRTRYALKQRANGKPRLSVLRSNSNIHAQIIDDTKSVTLVSASTIDKELRKAFKGNASNQEAARKVGELIASRAKAKNIDNVVFDRGSYIYHGCVKALADSAREHGLKF